MNSAYHVHVADPTWIGRFHFCSRTFTVLRQAEIYASKVIARGMGAAILLVIVRKAS